MKYGPNHSTARPLKIASELWKELSFSSFFSLSDGYTLNNLPLRYRKSPFTDAIMVMEDSKSFIFSCWHKQNKLRSNSRPTEIGETFNVNNWKTDKELWLLLTTVLFTKVLSLPASNFNTGFCHLETNSIYMKPLK